MRALVVSIPLLISALLLAGSGYGQESTLSRKDIYKRCVLRAFARDIDAMKSIPNEDAFLSSFKVSAILPETTVHLSDMPNVVFKVRDSAGRSYVIRRTLLYMGDKVSDVPFERLSNTLAADIPGVHVPALRVLSPDDSRALISRLKAEGHLKDDLSERVSFDDSKVSVTPFYQSQSGREYLRSLGLSGELSQEIFYHRNTLKSYSADIAKMRLVRAWNEDTPEQRKVIREDLALLVPALRGVSKRDFAAALVNHFDQIMTEKVSKGLTVRSWYRLPEKIRTQLANHWAMYEALGIDDFHGNNWLINKGSVIGIDVAQQTPEFDSGSAYIGHQYAGIRSDRDAGNDILQTLFRANISPKTRDYLLSLDREQILAIANRAEFPMDDLQVEGILARIAVICRRN